jgi:hypothetical protein
VPKPHLAARSHRTTVPYPTVPTPLAAMPSRNSAVLCASTLCPGRALLHFTSAGPRRAVPRHYVTEPGSTITQPHFSVPRHRQTIQCPTLPSRHLTEPCPRLTRPDDTVPLLNNATYFNTTPPLYATLRHITPHYAAALRRCGTLLYNANAERHHTTPPRRLTTQCHRFTEPNMTLPSPIWTAPHSRGTGRNNTYT